MLLPTVDVAAIAKIFGKEVERDSTKYMAAERLLVDFKLRSSRFKVRDTVNHGSVIGESRLYYFKVKVTIYASRLYNLIIT